MLERIRSLPAVLVRDGLQAPSLRSARGEAPFRVATHAREDLLGEEAAYRGFYP